MEAQVISKVSRRSLEVEAVEGLAGRQPGFGEVAFEPWAFSPPRVWLTARLSCAFSPQRDRWFANSPLEGDGFEPSVPRLFGRPSIPAQFTFRVINRLPRDRNPWFESIPPAESLLRTGPALLGSPRVLVRRSALMILNRNSGAVTANVLQQTS